MREGDNGKEVGRLDWWWLDNTNVAQQMDTLRPVDLWKNACEPARCQGEHSPKP